MPKDQAKEASWRNVWIRSLPLLALPLLFLYAITLQTDIPLRYFFEDLPAALHLPALACVVTSTTVILWCSSGLIAFFAASLGDARYRKPLRIVGAFSIFLGIDDLVMFHETLLPEWLGVSGKSGRLTVESALFLVYGFILLYWIRLSWKLFNSAVKSFLAASVFNFAASLSIDMASSLKLFPRWSRFSTDQDFHMFVEDGPKLIGVVLWSFCLWHFGKSAVKADAS